MTDLSSRFSLQVPEEHREAGPDGGGPQLGDGHPDQRLGRHEGKLRGVRVQRRPARLGGGPAPHQVQPDLIILALSVWGKLLMLPI